MTDLRTPRGRLANIVGDIDHEIKMINADIKRLRAKEELLQAKLELIRTQQYCSHMHHHKGLFEGSTEVYVCSDCGLVWSV